MLKRFGDNEEAVRRARAGLSIAYVNMGNYPKGEAELEILLQRNPDEAGPNNDLGYLYAEQGKNLEKAESMIQKALQEDPDNAAYLDSMGWVLFKRGKLKEALETMKRAAEAHAGRAAVPPTPRSSSTSATCTSSSSRSTRPRTPGVRPSRPPRKLSHPTSNRGDPQEARVIAEARHQGQTLIEPIPLSELPFPERRRACSVGTVTRLDLRQRRGTDPRSLIAIRINH